MKEKTIISREYVEKELKIHEISGMTIGVIKDGKTVLAEGYGTADITSERKPDSQSLFGIASCTKSFTAAIIAMLVDRGNSNMTHRSLIISPTSECTTITRQRPARSETCSTTAPDFRDTMRFTPMRSTERNCSDRPRSAPPGRRRGGGGWR